MFVKESFSSALSYIVTGNSLICITKNISITSILMLFIHFPSIVSHKQLDVYETLWDFMRHPFSLFLCMLDAILVMILFEITD